MEEIKKLLGERVRFLRVRRGWSQEELGERTWFHYTYIGVVERGETNCTVVALSKLADGLGITVQELFAFPEEGMT